jgi:hypothetical protein
VKKKRKKEKKTRAKVNTSINQELSQVLLGKCSWTHMELVYKQGVEAGNYPNDFIPLFSFAFLCRSVCVITFGTKGL